MIHDQQPLLQRTSLDGIWMWSRWQPERALNFNSFYLQGEESIVVDPLAIEEEDLATLRSLGGAQWVVITNRDHERRSRAVAEALGARIAASALDAPLPRNLLVGDGACIFGNAADAIDACLESRRDVYVNRVNVDDGELGS